MDKPPPAKRPKVAVACSICRSKKIKCDGMHPVCGPCFKRSDSSPRCSYSRDRKLPDQRGSRALEHVAGSGNYEPHSVLSPSSRGFGYGAGDPTYVLSGSDWAGRHARHSTAHATDTSVQSTRWAVSDTIDSKDRHTETDSMTGLVADTCRSQVIFGSSSAGSFMRQIKAAIDVKLGLPHPRQPASGTSNAIRGPQGPKSGNGGDNSQRIEYLLPPRKTADKLASAYWELVYPLYPFIDRSLIEESYRSIWSGDSAPMDESMAMCMVNLIFALGAQLTDSIELEHRKASANMYFKRAQDLLRLDLWDVGSTELIQCLLLMGQYLQTTDNPHQCWMVIGHAIRVAQELGFHLSEYSLDLPSSRETELVRRIWHGCVMMDRVLSMTFGRPPMISKQLSDTVPLPIAVDDALLGPQRLAVQPEGLPSETDFFVRALLMYGIVYDILIELYSGATSSTQNSSFISSPHQHGSVNMAKILELDGALMAWSHNLPPHLQAESPESARDSISRRGAVVCRVRFLHARILLFRPILSQFCLPQNRPEKPGESQDDSLADQMSLQCSALCFKSAHSLIEVVHKNLVYGKTGVLPAWWYCVLYVYTAATVLLAERLRPIIAAGISEYSIAESWSRAIAILKSFTCLGESAKRCVAALEILSAKVSMHSVLPESLQEQSIDPEPLTPIPDVVFDDVLGGLDCSGIVFDSHDMLWLTSVPGNL
ncbi:hypothetical protein GGI43DRAFT_416099 [Trichoderma evansii]